MEWFTKLPIEIAFAMLAVAGGFARYLNGYTNGAPFKLSVFIASGAVAGFSGYMFAVLGQSMNLPDPMLFVMAGTGGFFGEQTMKYIMEKITENNK